VHLERLRNVDLVGKGYVRKKKGKLICRLYFIRAVLHDRLEGSQITCSIIQTAKSMCHFVIFTKFSANRKGRYDESLKLNENSYKCNVESKNSGRTQVFMIKYNDQEALLNEIFKFQITANLADIMRSDYGVSVEFQLCYIKE
jgi:hypothetical protein